MNATQRLESELARLNVGTTRTRPEGISVYDDDPDLPAGLVRVSDGTGTVYGEPDALADALAALPATGAVSADGADLDWELVWDTLGATGLDRLPTAE